MKNCECVKNFPEVLYFFDVGRPLGTTRKYRQNQEEARQS